MSGYDETDIGPGVINNNKNIKTEIADPCDSIIALFVITTFIADIVTDILLAHQFYQDKEWLWFTLTVILIVLPSLTMQVFSCVIFHLQSKKLNKLSILLHVLQLGLIERYLNAFYYGTKTLCVENAKKEDLAEYLKSWRDVAMIRLIETSMESGPQLILQLYILSTYDRKITIEQDYIVIISALVSLTSLAVSLVSYTNTLRLHDRDKGLSICGYIFQMTYRLFIILSRIVAFTLFAMEFEWWLLLVISLHWIIMVVSLIVMKTNFCKDASKCRQTLEFLFKCVLGFIYVFCFLTPNHHKTKFKAVCYYTFLFVENSLLIAIWYPTRKQEFHILEYGAICFVWGGFFIGIFTLLIYYKYFHPNNDISEKCTQKCIDDVTKCLPFLGNANDKQTKNTNPGYRDDFDVIVEEEKYIYDAVTGKTLKVNGNSSSQNNFQNLTSSYSDSTFV